MSEDLTPQEKDRRATQKAEGRYYEQAPPSENTQTWIWVLVGVIVLIALAGGAVAGFIGGFFFQPVTDYVELLGATLTQSSGEVFFDTVSSGQASDIAGIQEDDRMISIDGDEIGSVSQAKRIIEGHKAGDVVKIVVKRPPGFIQEYSVTLGAVVTVVVPTERPPIPTPTYPPPPPQQQGTIREARLGIDYRMLVEGDPFEVSDGALVITAWEGNPAYEAGVRIGDIITSVGGIRLSESVTLEIALDNFSAGERVKLYVLSGGEYKNIFVWLGSK